MQELNLLYVRSGLEFQGPKQKYLKYEKRSRIERGRYIKWGRHQWFANYFTLYSLTFYQLTIHLFFFIIFF